MRAVATLAYDGEHVWLVRQPREVRAAYPPSGLLAGAITGDSTGYPSQKT